MNDARSCERRNRRRVAEGNVQKCPIPLLRLNESRQPECLPMRASLEGLLQSQNFVQPAFAAEGQDELQKEAYVHSRARLSAKTQACQAQACVKHPQSHQRKSGVSRRLEALR
jgi:hypothetical protein